MSNSGSEKIKTIGTVLQIVGSLFLGLGLLVAVIKKESILVKKRK